MTYNPEAKPIPATDFKKLWLGDPYAQEFPELRYYGWVEPLDLTKPLDGKDR